LVGIDNGGDIKAKANNTDFITTKSDPSMTQLEKDRNKKWDDAFYNKFENPSTFFEQLFNTTGPNKGAMEILVEWTDIDQGAGTESDLMQCNIIPKLHSLL
jgi:hypothetical protein